MISRPASYGSSRPPVPCLAIIAVPSGSIADDVEGGCVGAGSPGGADRDRRLAIRRHFRSRYRSHWRVCQLRQQDRSHPAGMPALAAGSEANRRAHQRPFRRPRHSWRCRLQVRTGRWASVPRSSWSPPHPWFPDCGSGATSFRSACACLASPPPSIAPKFSRRIGPGDKINADQQRQRRRGTRYGFPGGTGSRVHHRTFIATFAPPPPRETAPATTLATQ